MKNVIFSALLVISSIPVFSQGAKISSVQTFDAHKNTNLEVQNKYGAIQFSTWDKDQIEIRLTISAKDKRTLDNMKDKVLFNSGNNRVSVINKNFEGSEKRSLGESILDDLYITTSIGKSAHIDMEIKLPKQLGQLYVLNTFGDISFTDLNGPVNIILKHGKLKGNSINQIAKIDLFFCSMNVARVENMELSAEHSNINIKDVNKLDIKKNSFGSAVISNVNTANINNYNYGKININTVKTINADTKFSDIIIEHLLYSGRINYAYAKLKINNIDPEFKNLTIAGQFGNAYLQTSKSLSARLEAEVNMGEIVTNNITFEKISKQDNVRNQSLSGTIRCNNDCSLISVKINYGDLYIGN